MSNLEISYLEVICHNLLKKGRSKEIKLILRKIMAELITMTQKELSRYEVIKRLIRKEINGTEAAKQLNLTIRQVKNIKARVIKEGPRGVIHLSTNLCLRKVRPRTEDFA